MKVWYYLFHW